MIRNLVLVLALLVVAMPTSVAHAAASATFIFQTDMHGSNVVPPVETQAWGFVRFYFNEERTEADYTVDVKGLSGTLVEGADLRAGLPGADGPVVRQLAGAGFIVTGGRLRLGPEEVAEFIAGNYYVTLYTKEHPEGELRGQVYVPSGFLPGTASNGTDRTFAGIPAPLGPVYPSQPPPAVLPPVSEAQNQASDEPSAELPPPLLPRGGIRPPNTGDAGLIDGSSEAARVAAPGLTAALMCVSLASAIGFLRRCSRDLGHLSN